MNNERNRLTPETLADIKGMSRAAKSRLLGPETANARLAARNKNKDHVAERPHLKTTRTALHYRNLLRCPDVVFRRYGTGLR